MMAIPIERIGKQKHKKIKEVLANVASSDLNRRLFDNKPDALN
jgi:hypothetical protein